VAVRDPSGNRPLSLAKGPRGGYFVASETCVFDTLEVKHIRNIEPGEMLKISHDGLESHMLPWWKEVPLARCIFEWIYYSFPSSCIFGEPVWKMRSEWGMILEQEAPVLGRDNVIIDVPDSSKFFADGYALSGRSGVRGTGLLRNHYTGRTFIEEFQELRDIAVARKFHAVPDVIHGNDLVIVDDSIERFTTIPRICRKMEMAGARSWHVRIGSPRITHPCFYGIDTPTKKELYANHMSVRTAAKQLGAKTLAHISIEGMLSKTRNPEQFCTACFTGNYPLGVTDHR